MSSNKQDSVDNGNVSNTKASKHMWIIGALAGILFGCLIFRESIQSGYPEATEILLIALFAIIGTTVGIVISKWTSFSKQVKYGIVGALLGAVLGIPSSYFMQPGIFRGFISIVKYVTNFAEYVNDSDLQSNAITGIVIVAIIGTVVGVVMARKHVTSDSK